ncbi:MULTISPECIES: hypothetical protein [Paenibacillus]|uniref:Fur-regulated basic protein FbpA n=1 Tax=Paenibacillus oleatilyticus TaxID=2594886 RepID=A0ABV4V6E9_9BACL|nr:hypothetical protein [Paenibacillus tyrfis]GLI09951.1 hypothetical protein YDYSG_59840 [Paenibacillus tyrfis]GMX66957.1 hypothetical protein Elgi_62300 [Paenibacillus elgii]
MLFSNRQKKLILDVLLKERRRLFSRHKGELLDKTIEDLSQMLRNEEINAEPKDNVIDWSRKGGKRR